MSEPVIVPGAQPATTAVRLLGQFGDTPQARPEAGPLPRMVGWLRTRIRYVSTLRALKRLDDRTLADIGIERPTLPATAWCLSRPGQ
jgi:uncharacterized protein YjiS (DUF1127 family)